ncbi:gliding motility-associated C-terminal domain-containing protein [Litoribaculum gwangyangense]
MKTKPLFGVTKSFVTLMTVFLLAIFSMHAQCPIVTNSSPPPICDASGYTFADLSSDYATDGGNGIVWYSLASGGVPFNNSQLVRDGLTYYADDNSGSCGVRQSITIDFQVNPSGDNLDKIYCSNENRTIQDYIDEVLLPSFPLGVTSVEIFYDLSLTIQANTTDTLSVGGTNLYIVFIDGSNCRSQIELAQVGVFSSPADPTPANPQAFCSDTNPTIADLNPGTTATNYSWYNNVDVFGDPIPPVLASTTPLVNGNTYYIQINDVFCTSNAVPVMVEVDDPVDAGNSEALEYCNDNLPAPLNLFDELTGTPDITGTWKGPVPTSNGHLGTVDISSLTTAGTYTFTYTVLSNNACPNATSNITITVFETLTSGTPSLINPESFCEASLPVSFDLFTLIENYDTGGQWTQGTLSTDPVVTSPLDLTGFIPGTYNFTYFQNLLPNPCPEESTTVQVIVLADPNAGVAINQVFCENELAANSPFDLFNALDGSQDDNSGTWTDSSNNVISNSLDLTTLTISGSPYTYNYTIDNGICSDTEAITITIEPAPESGIANPPVEFCEGAAPSNFNLFDLLTGEDQTGTWNDDNASGALTGNTVDLSGLAAATYSFTYDVTAIGSCDDVNVTVSIIINPLPNTGTPTNATFCENDLVANSPLDLFGQLSGTVDAGGIWNDDNTSGALSGSNLDLTILTIGSYNYTYSITDANGCTNSSTVTVTIEDAPESGIANPPVEFCEGAAPSSFNLFDLLTGEDQTGTWNDDNASGALTGNTVDLSGLSAATYNFTYDVTAIGSCDDVNVTVSIIINPLPNTGTPTNATFCENDLVANSPLDLFGQLSGTVDAGGLWNDDNISGALSGSNVDLTILTIGSYNYTYSITDANGCSNSSTVTVTIEDAPESGTPNSPAEFCLADITTGQTYNLFDLLTGEDQTGIWNDDNASGALTGNTLALDVLTQGTFNFTFDVTAIGSCDDVNVTVSIVINDTPAPTVSSTQEFCDTATVADLVATGTAIQWYDAATGGATLAGSTVLIDGQTYYATQTDATTGCESSVRTPVLATIYISPNAGAQNITPIVACNNDNNIDLFTGLDGTQDAGGIWNNDNAIGSLSGNIFDSTGVSAGTYSFTYTVVASAPCLDDSETITITIEEPLSAGTDGAPLDLCSNNGTVDLFTQLGGTPDVGGTWSPALASGTGVFDPLVDADGTYSYTVANACGTNTSNVVVTVTLAPNAGTDNSVALCRIDAPIDLFLSLGAAAQSGGTWSPALASGTGIFDPAIDAPGVYTYTVNAVTPCAPDSTADIIVIVDDTPTPPVTNSNPEFCAADVPIVSDLNSLISSTGTINWYQDAALTLPLNGSEALVDGEDYFATQTNSTGCESSSSAQINAIVNDSPTPILLNPAQEYCINDDPTINDLTSNLNYNSAQYNVVWYDSDIGGATVSGSMTLTNTTYYAALIDITTGCESSIRLSVTPNVTACGQLQLPDGFSPNGDGVNDTFDVDNLAIIYPNFEIEIYNRNGNIVYKGNANTPRFDGTSNQSRVVAKGNLPVGVYFYIFRFNDGVNNPEQGRLYLSR